MKNKEIKEGIFLNSLSKMPFKTNRVSINCFVKLNENTSSAYAILPFLLRKRSKKIDNLKKMGKTLMNLYGASLSANCNKIGDNQVLTVSIETIDDSYALNNENLTEQSTKILLEILLNPYLEDGTFNKEDVEIEKKNLIELIESEFNDKRTYAIEKTISLMFKGKPFGLNRYGDIEKIKKLTPNDILTAYRNLIKTANIQIMTFTKSDIHNLENIIIDSFKDINREDIYKINVSEIDEFSEVKEYEESQKIEQMKLVLGFKIDKLDEREKYAMALLNYIYGATPISKLFLTVREKFSLCYYCVSRYNKIKNIMLVDCGIEKKNIKKAKDEILNQLDEIKNKKVDDEQFLQTKLAYKNSLKSLLDSTHSLESFYLLQIAQNKLNTPQMEIDKIEDISLEEVIKVAQKVKYQISFTLIGE